MATQDLGSLGRAAGVPVLTQWRWYYNLPSLPIWIALLLMVVVPRHNRHWQAWLILLLPLLAACFSLLLGWLIPGSEGVGQFVVALAIAWTGVWLLAPWLRHGNQAGRLFQVCAVMAVVGIVAYLGFYGAWASSEVTWPVIGCWATCAISLVAAAGMTGLCCRSECGPVPLVFWPMLWLPIACVLCASVLIAVSILSIGAEVDENLLEMAVGIGFMGLILSIIGAGALYIFDLPVMLLRILSPCYRERFRVVFCTRRRGTPAAFGPGKEGPEESPTHPFGE